MIAILHHVFIRQSRIGYRKIRGLRDFYMFDNHMITIFEEKIREHKEYKYTMEVLLFFKKPLQNIYCMIKRNIKISFDF